MGNRQRMYRFGASDAGASRSPPSTKEERDDFYDAGREGALTLFDMCASIETDYERDYIMDPSNFWIIVRSVSSEVINVITSELGEYRNGSSRYQSVTLRNKLISELKRGFRSTPPLEGFTMTPLETRFCDSSKGEVIATLNDSRAGDAIFGPITDTVNFFDNRFGKRKLHRGPKGGMYYKKNGKKVYVSGFGNNNDESQCFSIHDYEFKNNIVNIVKHAFHSGESIDEANRRLVLYLRQEIIRHTNERQRTECKESVRQEIRNLLGQEADYFDISVNQNGYIRFFRMVMVRANAQL